MTPSEFVAKWSKVALTERSAAQQHFLDLCALLGHDPPEWVREEVLEFPGAVDGPWARYVHEPDQRGIGTVRWPRLVPRDDECAAKLAQRTLTKLYNERPAWLDLAHRKLDEAVFAAYNRPLDVSDDEVVAKLLALNLERAAAQGSRGRSCDQGPRPPRHSLGA